MDKIEAYLEKFLPRVRKLEGAGIYEVYSEAGGVIGHLGKAGVQLLKDRLLLEGLKLNIKTEVEARDTNNTESGSH